MRELYDKETNFRTYGSNDEFGFRPVEDGIVREQAEAVEIRDVEEERIAKSEYNETAVFVTEEPDEEQKTKKHHDILKNFVLKPAVSLTLIVSLAFSSQGIDFLGDDYLSSAFTTMNSGWIENHPEEIGSEPHGHWHEPQKEPWDESWEEPWDESWDESWEEPSEESWEEPQDDGFPVLENLDPDYEGKYSGADYGPELYVRFSFANESAYKYLVKGSAWDTLDPEGTLEERLDGAYYDSATNTLTLENFNAAVLDVNLMGNGFRVRVLGECRVEFIQIWGFGYGGSVTFEGDGVLNSNGIALTAEASRSCVMVRRGVTINVTADSSEGALSVSDTLHDVPLYLAPGVNIEGGIMAEIRREPYETENGEKLTVYTFASFGEDGEPARQIVISG